MIKRLLVLTLLGVFAATQTVAAAPLSITRDDQREVMVTIYNGNLGLVKDLREVRLDSGLLEAQFMDVAALIDPTSVHLKSLTDPTGLRILEQNYEFDLLTSQKLMEKYVGRKVRLYQSNGSFQEATLLSTQGPVYEINGQIHMGHFGNVVLPSLPENLVSKPTLVWMLRNAKAAPQKVEASYLTGGINWKADYVMVINPADNRSDLTGWVTIDNKSGATYKNAALKLVAGDINRALDRGRAGRVMELAAQNAPASKAERDFKSEGFFEYHLYTLDGRTTIKDNQTKQLALMAASDVPVDKHFIYYRRRLLPHAVRGARVQSESRRVPRAEEQQGEPPRDASPQGEGAGLQGRHLGQPAAHRRRLDRPYAQRRAHQDQDGRRLRCGGRAGAEGLEAHRSQPLRGRVGDLAPQPQA